MLLLDVDLKMFDGEGGAPSGTSGQQADSGVAAPTSGKETVVYGKVEEDGQSTEQKTDGDNKDVDPSAKFEELIKGEYKEHFDKRVQDIINKRFKEVKALEKKSADHDSFMSLLQRKYGTEDSAQIMQMVENEIVEELAYQNDMSPENYRRIMQAEQIQKQNEIMESEHQRQEQIRLAVEKWNAQAEECKAEYPDFDLPTAMQDDKFVDLIKSNVPVKTAYELLNFEKIKQQMRKETEAKTAQSISVKQSRPTESALKGQSGVIVKSDVSSLTRKDREEIARRAQRGEQIRF